MGGRNPEDGGDRLGKGAEADRWVGRGEWGRGAAGISATVKGTVGGAPPRPRPGAARPAGVISPTTFDPEWDPRINGSGRGGEPQLTPANVAARFEHNLNPIPQPGLPLSGGGRDFSS